LGAGAALLEEVYAVEAQLQSSHIFIWQLHAPHQVQVAFDALAGAG
jgi:hypothetical protein